MANNKLPWKIAIVIDSKIQKRSALHTDNAQRFNHGKGFVIGHQWTNIILIINDMIIPLPPIPYHTKNYCQKNALEYKTEHDLVVEYISDLNLEDYIGHYDPKEVEIHYHLRQKQKCQIRKDLFDYPKIKRMVTNCRAV